MIRSSAPWALALWVGCAPAYRPPAPFLPLLEEEGDANVAVHLGTGGAQVDGAYAISDGFALRGKLQGAGYASQGHYGVATMGIGIYGADPGGGFRWGVTIEGGGGLSRGVSDVTVTSRRDGATTSSEVIRFQNSGVVIVTGLRPELGVEAEGFAVGTVLGISHHVLLHDDASDGTGVGQGVLVEPVVVARGGVHPVAIEAYFGLAWPVWVLDDVGLPVPFMAGLGLTFDLRTTPPVRRP